MQQVSDSDGHHEHHATFDDDRVAQSITRDNLYETFWSSSVAMCAVLKFGFYLTEVQLGMPLPDGNFRVPTSPDASAPSIEWSNNARDGTIPTTNNPSIQALGSPASPGM